MAFLDYISRYAYKRFKTAATEVWKERKTERISLHVIKTHTGAAVKLPSFLASVLVRGKLSVSHPGSFTRMKQPPTQPLHWEERKFSLTVQNRTPDYPPHRTTTHSRPRTWLASRTEPRTCLSTHHRPIKRGEVQRQEINQPVAYKMQQRTVKRSFIGKIKLQTEK